MKKVTRDHKGRFARSLAADFAKAQLIETRLIDRVVVAAENYGPIVAIGAMLLAFQALAVFFIAGV
jgi:hypothetical protein